MQEKISAMSGSSASAPSAVSDSTHRFPWKWRLIDLGKVPKNGLTVFSCFSCGGGSSMGYKLAGYNVVGNVEIDPRVMQVYETNLHPKHPFLMDVRDFLKVPTDQLPKELFSLDILDGSPPCSPFSTSGERDKGWSTERVFKEGQTKQRLDDLFIYFIKIAKRLRPKVVIAENVPGLIKGKAKGYVNEIFKAFSKAGYDTQLFLLNSAYMGVPQERERCFFIARRKDLCLPEIKLAFYEKPILFGEVRTEQGREKPLTPKMERYLKYMKPTDKDVGDILRRVIGTDINFNWVIAQDHYVAQALTAAAISIRGYDKQQFSDRDYVNIQTFPQDYDFRDQRPRYICGMSVPPVMMAQIATQVYEQLLKGVSGCVS